MGECCFIDNFNRLRKSSSDSIDNVSSFNAFRGYMHVTRNTETDLKKILRSVNADGKKTLILLCGSAGDGKSHLLSYLKNADEEHLIENYSVLNDATESNAPDKTAVETLYNRLYDFKDDRLEIPGKNIIIAINLGVLSNFIESEYANEFSALKKYVIESNILSSKVTDICYNQESHFQHISFSDYHMFSLKKEGISPEYIEAIFEKVISDNPENIFYSSHESDCCTNCPLCSKCPIKLNYEFFCLPNVRHYIAMTLAKTIIKDKEILTTRELLNYVYDIVVAPAFDYSNFIKDSVNSSKFLKNFLNCITPSILYDNADMSSIMNKTRAYDPLLNRNENEDDLAIEYYVSEDISTVISTMLQDSPYHDILNDRQYSTIFNDDKSLKTKLFNILIRTRDLVSNSDYDQTFSEYISDLYSYNAGKIAKLVNLYSDVEKAIISWCGNETEGNICIDDTHKGFSIYENIKFTPYLDNIPKVTNADELQKFLTFMVVEYQGENNIPIRLDVDYSLYDLVKKLKKGYIQTAEDRNNHADFISFISKILKTGSSDKTITVLSENNKKAILEKTMFGTYKFKVVK